MKISYIAVLLLAAFSVCTDAAYASSVKPRPTSQTTAQQPAMSETVKNLLSRAKKGDAAAQNELGVCYMKGSGVAANDTLAYKWFTKAAAQKYDKAIVNMAYCLRHGKGIKSDSVKARALYTNVIARKNDTIISRLEEAAKKDIFLSRTFAYAYSGAVKGIKRNPSAEKTYLKQAIELGDKSALYPYAELCLRTRDHVSAQKYYGMAYRNGNRNAAYWYGRYLINGEGGNANPAEGYKLVYPFALDGNTGAMLLVGQSLLEGNGVKQNPKEAAEWLRKASDNGSPEALWQYALCNADGNGIDRDMLMAFHLMNRQAMFSSENRFKEFMDPGKGTSAKMPVYVLFLQGLKAVNDSNFKAAQKIAKELGKQKAEKESKLIEGFAQLAPANPKRNVKKGFKLLSPYLDSDPLLLYIVDRMQLEGVLEGLEKANMRNVLSDMEKLGQQGFGDAYSLLGDIYLDGKEGVTASDQRALNYWLKANQLNALSYTTAQVLAKCYEEGLGGLKKDVDKARKLRNQYRTDQLSTLMQIIPAYPDK